MRREIVVYNDMKNNATPLQNIQFARFFSFSFEKSLRKTKKKNRFYITKAPASFTHLQLKVISGICQY